ncbi:unnamed protein product [Symbiodinium sp. KB8]|nr:unnamed protein product [Symbiodinium sp. KB8]
MADAPADDAPSTYYGDLVRFKKSTEPERVIALWGGVTDQFVVAADLATVDSAAAPQRNELLQKNRDVVHATLTACTELNKVLSVDQLHYCIMKKYDVTDAVGPKLREKKFERKKSDDSDDKKAAQGLIILITSFRDLRKREQRGKMKQKKNAKQTKGKMKEKENVKQKGKMKEKENVRTARAEYNLGYMAPRMHRSVGSAYVVHKVYGKFSQLRFFLELPQRVDKWTKPASTGRNAGVPPSHLYVLIRLHNPEAYMALREPPPFPGVTSPIGRQCTKRFILQKGQALRCSFVDVSEPALNLAIVLAETLPLILPSFWPSPFL